METNSVDFFNRQQYPELKIKPIVAAWQIINPENIGSLIRIADNVGAEEVFILGDNFNLRAASIKKTAGLSFANIKLTFIDVDAFFEQLPAGKQIVAIETSDNSLNIFQTSLPNDIVLLVGNERRGLPDELLAKCALSVHIPMTGRCKSMNVSHALAVALFEWQRQMLF